MKKFKIMLTTLLLGLLMMVTSCDHANKVPKEDPVTDNIEVTLPALTPNDATVRYLAELDSITIQTVYYDLPAVCIYAIYERLGATASKIDVYKEYVKNQSQYEAMQYGALLYREMCEKGFDKDNIIKLYGEK